MATNLSLRRKLLFAAILVSLALALTLGLLEGGLRLAGFGSSPHFFRHATLPGGERIIRENRDCTVPYFTAALARRPQPVRLPARKAPGTCRIFILGSSAAMGDPDASFSLGRMLEAMLRAAYPQTRFEVVNAAVTAINSHLVRGIAADCARLEPDLFIVYEGHNEVIGPFGPAGVLAPFVRTEPAVRTAVWLKGSRIGQLIAAAGRAVRRKPELPSEWGGMPMFLNQQIPADDPRLDAVRAHFRANLLDIAASARRAGAAALVCTVLTNDRDFAPFFSRHRAGLAATDLARWEAAVATGDAAERAHDPAAAELAYRTALALDDRHAELVFRLGRTMLELGRDAEARELLPRARDLDTLRFRTDSTLNQIVRDLPKGDPTVEVVDLAASLATRSAHGVVGDDLLYEHVHLTFRGTYEAARELFPHVVARLARRRLVSGPAPVPFGSEEARIRLGYTVHEQAMIAIQLLSRFRAAPFTGQADNAARISAWERRRQAATALLARPDATDALRELAHRTLELAPDDWIIARNIGALLVERHVPDEALPLLRRASTWIDDDIDTLIPLGWAQRALGRTAEADATFAHARALAPRYPGLPENTPPPK